MIIVDLIKELMWQQDKSIKDVVNGTGLSYGYIENIVKYYIVPSPENAKIILEYLGVSLDEVLMLY